MKHLGTFVAGSIGLLVGYVAGRSSPASMKTGWASGVDHDPDAKKISIGRIGTPQWDLHPFEGAVVLVSEPPGGMSTDQYAIWAGSESVAWAKLGDKYGFDTTKEKNAAVMMDRISYIFKKVSSEVPEASVDQANAVALAVAAQMPHAKIHQSRTDVPTSQFADPGHSVFSPTPIADPQHSAFSAPVRMSTAHRVPR
jgi:hypothetical protein